MKLPVSVPYPWNVQMAPTTSKAAPARTRPHLMSPLSHGTGDRLTRTLMPTFGAPGPVSLVVEGRTAHRIEAVRKEDAMEGVWERNERRV